MAKFWHPIWIRAVSIFEINVVGIAEKAVFASARQDAEGTVVHAGTRTVPDFSTGVRILRTLWKNGVFKEGVSAGQMIEVGIARFPNIGG